jgi:cytochrome d ubiquinol oxidase subunit I
LVAVGAGLSAIWILVANAWMQNPVGMHFNPDTARSEMVNFWDVFLSPMAVIKFIHTLTSGFVLAGIFVTGICAWFLLKKRDIIFAKKSMLVSSVFGFISCLLLLMTGDNSARQVALLQPMKLASMEGLYEGKIGADLMVMGLMSPEKDPELNALNKFLFRISIPQALSYMIHFNGTTFVPGVKDLLNGNDQQNIISANEKIARGKLAIETLQNYKKALDDHQTEEARLLREKFVSKDFQVNYFKYFGYGYLSNTKQLIPNIPLVFYSFHLMVILGSWFLVFFFLSFFHLMKGTLLKQRWLLWLGIITIPLVYIAQMAGWTVAEMGRQPWVVQDLLPTMTAVSQLSSQSVMITFWLFAVLFTTLLIAEIRIMTRQIKEGPKGEEAHHV